MVLCPTLIRFVRLKGKHERGIISRFCAAREACPRELANGETGRRVFLPKPETLMKSESVKGKNVCSFNSEWTAGTLAEERSISGSGGLQLEAAGQMVSYSRLLARGLPVALSAGRAIPPSSIRCCHSICMLFSCPVTWCFSVCCIICHRLFRGLGLLPFTHSFETQHLFVYVCFLFCFFSCAGLY